VQVSFLERVSKTAAKASVPLILALTLAVHPDITWLLRGLAAAAFAAGWLVAARAPLQTPIWLGIAIVSPALLRLAAAREGPVLDLVWLAGLSGGLLRITPWSRWTLPFPWSVLIGGWALALSLGWPVLMAREVGFRLAGFHDAGAINSWSMLTGAQSAMWIAYVVLAQLAGALWFEWAREARIHPIKLLHPLWAGTTAASLVAVIQGTVDLGFLSTEFWASLRRATGTMLDANSFGMCAALAAPVGFVAMRAAAPNVPAAAAAVFAINAAGMWLSGSRTALLCGMLGTAGLVFGLWRERRLQRARYGAETWIPIGVAAAALLALLTSTTSPIERALDIPAGRAGLAALWNRGGYGPIALRMTREHPLTGVGSGSYRTLAPDYWREMADDALPLDNAQNWWRHQIAELGVLGGALIVAFSILVAWRVLTGRDGGADVAASWTSRGLLAGLGATSLFGMPTQNPVVLCWFLLLTAWFARLVPEPTTQRERRPGELRAAWVVASVLAIGYAAGHIALARGSLHPIDRARRAHRDYVMGAYPREPLPGTNQFQWTGLESRFFWAARTRYMAIRFWVGHPDVETRPVRVTLTSPCGVLFDEELTSHRSMSLGLALPEDQSTLEATVRVSRTWSPADSGQDDRRQLGVGILADFSNDPAFAVNQLRAVKLSGCGGGV